MGGNRVVLRLDEAISLSIARISQTAQSKQTYVKIREIQKQQRKHWKGIDLDRKVYQQVREETLGNT